MLLEKFNKKGHPTYIIGAGLDLGVEAVLVLVPEGRVADEENVEDDAAGPDVHRLPVGVLLQHLRTEVARGARKAVPRLLVALHLDGQAKVRQLHRRTLRLARQKQVLRLGKDREGVLVRVRKLPLSVLP